MKYGYRIMWFKNVIADMRTQLSSKVLVLVINSLIRYSYSKDSFRNFSDWFPNFILHASTLRTREFPQGNFFLNYVL